MKQPTHTRLRAARLICAVLTACTLVVPTSSALAHGDLKPKHGGVAVHAHDLNFELVATPEGAVLHVDDHGKAVTLAGMRGKLTVLAGSDKTEAPLQAAGNTLIAKGLKLPPGAKVVAAITQAQGPSMTVRFVVRK